MLWASKNWSKFPWVTSCCCFHWSASSAWLLGGALPFWSIRPNLIPKMLPRYGACRLSSCSHISQGVEVLHVLQGQFGAPSPKPTHLLSLNLPELPAALRECAVCEQPPKRSAIGLQTDGQWATAKLKEYPPALCFAFAKCFYTHLRSVRIDDSAAQADDFLSQCQTLLVQDFSVHFGKDFAG